METLKEKHDSNKDEKIQSLDFFRLFRAKHIHGFALIKLKWMISELWDPKKHESVWKMFSVGAVVKDNY